MRSIGALAVLALCSLPASLAQPAAPAEIGITGRVLRPDGEPATQGSVLTMSGRTNQTTASIDRNGFFRVVPDAVGETLLFIAVPGFAPYRANVIVPPSRIVKLPAIALDEATYFRVRLVTVDGEALDAGGLRRRSADGNGFEIPDPLGHTRQQVERDGSIVIGPLPLGRLQLAYNRPPLAQTRLPDVNVTGMQPLIDGGTIVIGSGGQLQVDIRNADGSPIAEHEVWLEEAVQPSMLFFSAPRTNADGRTVFDRLAPGRYRVWTRTVDRCGSQPLSIARVVSSSGSGVANTRLVIGGRARLRFTSALGPIAGRAVSAAPDVPAQPPPWQPFLRASGRLPVTASTSSGCRGATDADGRLTLEPFPPGPAQVRIDLFNSTYVIRLTVPDDEREVSIVVPEGVVSAHVSDRDTQRPIGSARVTWTGGGSRVEATATPNGDVLLEGVGTAGGTLAVNAPGYEPLEGSFDETPGTPQEIAMTRLPPSMMRVRVVADDRPLPEAVIEWRSRGAATFTTVDASGMATLANVPPGALQLSAHAEGFKTVTISVAESARESVAISMTLPKPR